MKKTLLTSMLTILISTATANSVITGAGSSFVYPVMSSWTNTYYQKTNNQVNYQSIGSAGGLNQLKQGTVDFSAADIPLTEKNLKQAGWVQFPVVMGGIVPIVNLPGVYSNELTLDGSVLANIYLGKVTYWDDASIKALNPTLTLPHDRIIALHRADGSGTTYNFTSYLSSVSPAFKKQVGVNTIVKWPGLGIGAKGNAGVANQVQQMKDSIGYVEYAYAKESHLTTVGMVNKANNHVVASLKTFAAAAKNANWAAHPDFALMLVNQPGKNSWPILATTFVQLPVKNKNYAGVDQFFHWAFVNGDAAATSLDYIAVPSSVKARIYKVLASKQQ